MGTSSVRVTNRYRIVPPQQVRKQLKIKHGDQLLVDVYDGMIVLMPEPQSFSQALAGLHRDIWGNSGVDISRERDAWTGLPVEAGES